MHSLIQSATFPLQPAPDALTQRNARIADHAERLVRNRRCLDVVRRDVLAMHAGLEIDAGRAIAVLHERRTVHRAFLRQQVVALAQASAVQAEQSAYQFREGIVQ